MRVGSHKQTSTNQAKNLNRRPSENKIKKTTEQKVIQTRPIFKYIESKEMSKKDEKEYIDKIIKLEHENKVLKEKLQIKEKLINDIMKKFEEKNKKLREYKAKIDDLKAAIQSNINNSSGNSHIHNLQQSLDYFNMFDFDNFYDDKVQEEIALKQVEQQILDEICPNPDAMTYEQLLKLEEQVGSVNKGLSKARIDSLPNTRYKKRIFPENYQCIICMESFVENEDVKKLPCEHIFHKECIAQWLTNEKTCPFCKNEVI